MLIAWLGASSLTAQTDVTDTYLTNAGFDDESGWITGNIGQATAHAATGWTATSSGDTWWYGGAVSYGSSLTINSVAPPATNPEGKAEGGALGLSAGWGCTVKYTQEVTLPAGVYTLSYKAYNANTDATQANNYIGFTSSSASYYGTTTNFAANTWVEESVNFVLTTETSGSISVGMGAVSNGSSNNAKLFVDGVALTYKAFTDVTETNPVDLTSMVSNTQGAWTGATETPAYDGITMVAVFKSSDWIGDALSQTINGLPAGKYKLEVYCQAHSSWDTDAAAEGATGYTYLCANEYKLDVPIRNADGATTKQLYTFEDMAVTNGSLTISVVNEKLAANWLSVYVKSLTYLGPDKSLSEGTFNTNYASLSALSKDAVPSAFADEITSLNDKYSGLNATDLSLSELDAANLEMTNFLNIYESVADAYALFNTFTSECESTLTNSEEFEDGAKSAFEAALNTAKTDVENATTTDAINATYNTLETARQTYVVKADPTNNTYFDYTFLVTNPGFDNDKTGWTSTGGAQNKAIATNKTNGIITGKFFENWNGSAFTGEIYQTVSNLPSGIYKLKVAAFGNGTNVYANDKLTPVTTSDGAWYEVDQVKVGDGNLKLGIKNENATTWMGIDNASLYYYGFDVTTAQASVAELIAEAEELASQTIMNTDIRAKLNSAIEGADASKSTRKELVPMIETLNAAISEAKEWIAAYNEAKAPLTAALERFEADYNDGENGCKYPINSGTWATVIAKVEAATIAKDITDDYSSFVAVAEELEAALDAAQVSIDAYAEVAYAKTLGVATETAQTIIESNATSEEVLKATEDLKVLEYTTIMTLYTNDATESFVGSWTTTFSTASGESYSGNSHSYPDAWSGSYAEKSATQDITLPAGKYMIKVAGRGQVGASESITVNIDGTETTVPFFMIGNTGLGIDTNGATNFSADGTYANNNAGRGWQWRYVPVALEKATTITVTISGTINKQWISWDDFSIRAVDTQVKMSISDAKYSTFIAPFDVEIPTGVEVAKITGVEGNVLTEEAVTGTIPANTPVVLYSETPVNQTFSGLSLATADSYKVGYLTGVYTDTEVQTGDYVLVRKNNTGHVGFYLVGETLPTIKANSCYLTVDGSAAPMFSLERGEGTTSIEDAELTSGNVVIYDLAGRRVEKMEKGIYIVNGRKVIR